MNDQEMNDSSDDPMKYFADLFGNRKESGGPPKFDRKEEVGREPRFRNSNELQVFLVSIQSHLATLLKNVDLENREERLRAWVLVPHTSMPDFMKGLVEAGRVLAEIDTSTPENRPELPWLCGEATSEFGTVVVEVAAYKDVPSAKIAAKYPSGSYKRGQVIRLNASDLEAVGKFFVESYYAAKGLADGAPTPSVPFEDEIGF